MLLTDCIACQYGQHDDHIEIIEAVPHGMLGGAMCPCKGECSMTKQITEVMQGTVELLQQTNDDVECTT